MSDMISHQFSQDVHGSGVAGVEVGHDSELTELMRKQADGFGVAPSHEYVGMAQHFNVCVAVGSRCLLRQPQLAPCHAPCPPCNECFAA